MLLSGFQKLPLAAILTFSLISLVRSALSPHSSDPTLYCVRDSSTFVTTLNLVIPNAKCFRVQNGIFTEVLAEIPLQSKEEITYLNGYVLPGIIESHGHILQYGEMLESVSLYDAKSMKEVRDRIKEFLIKHEGEGYGTRDKWVRGIGWDQKYFSGVMPTAVSLI
jgi:predicted amidohydrolase YtcJ